MIPDNLVILSCNFNKINKATVKIARKNPWVMISVKSTGISRKTIEIPKTKTIFIILEPTILPITRPVSPCLAAVSDAASSGNEVPSATMDIPITMEETPRTSAIPFAPSTKNMAPTANPTMPIITCPIRRIQFISTVDLFSS